MDVDLPAPGTPLIPIRTEFATVRQTALDYLLCLLLMLRYDTLYKCHRLRQHGDIALQYALDYLVNGILPPCETLAVKVWIHYGWLAYAIVYHQSFIFFAVLWVFHCTIILLVLLLD